MAFGSGGACDQRRRRVLIEETLQAGQPVAAPAASERLPRSGQVGRLSTRRYADAARASEQMTAVIPQRLWTLTVLVLIGLCLIAGIQAYYGQAWHLHRASWVRSIAAWDVQQAGGLASWFSSMFLLAASFQAVQIYRLRRHRCDDYRGRYRLWLWISPALALAAVAAGTQVHRDLIELGQAALTLDPVWHAGSFMVALPAALWLAVALRLAFELRESRIALGALATATIAYWTATLIELLAANGPFSLPVSMGASSLSMLGNLAVLLSVTSYVRHVYLDVQEMTASSAKPRRERKPGDQAGKASRESQGQAAVLSLADARARKAAAPEPVTNPAERPASEARPISAATPPQQKPAAVVEQRHSGGGSSQAEETLVDEDGDEGPAGQRLSKAERRRLRRSERREPTRKAA